MPWPPPLVVANGRNNSSRMNSGVMPGPSIDDVDDDATTLPGAAARSTGPRRRGLDRVVEQVRHDGIERFRIDCGAGCCRRRLSSTISALRLRRQASITSCQPLSRRDQRVAALLPFGLQAGQQAADLADRGAHRRQHVALEFGIVGMDLGVGEQHRKLAGHVLDVVDDEGKALAVFAQLPGLRQDLRRAVARRPGWPPRVRPRVAGRTPRGPA